jgi:hypothetical protein
MKYFLLFMVLPVLLLAEEKGGIPAYAAISGLLLVLGLFFWGIYKAVKTQKLIYALALLPFTVLLFTMFFI